jgi:hypothetical protein
MRKLVTIRKKTLNAEQSPSGEANSRAAGQEISNPLWNTKVHWSSL